MLTETGATTQEFLKVRLITTYSLILIVEVHRLFDDLCLKIIRRHSE